MKLEQIVCSLELSKELKEAGVVQESLFYWHDIHGYPELEDFKANNYDDKEKYKQLFYTCFSAYTAEEILEMLPRYIQNFFPVVYSLVLSWDSELDYLYHMTYYTKNISGGKNLVSFSDRSLANASAKMLLYLKKNKLI